MWIVDRNSWCKKGNVAGSIQKNGYRRIRIMNRKYLAHRLAWFYVYGVWPKNDLDHRDTCRGNNWINNLRIATRGQNSMNRNKSSTSSTGLKGVCWHKRVGKWMAQIAFNKKNLYLGYFSTPKEASEAYEKKASELFGDFYRRSTA